jgi:hypothetical protein
MFMESRETSPLYLNQSRQNPAYGLVMVSMGVNQEGLVGPQLVVAVTHHDALSSADDDDTYGFCGEP